MKKNVAIMAASMALLGAGIARAQVDLAIEDENARRGDPLGLDLLVGDAVLAGRVAGRIVSQSPALGLPYDESHALKSQGDIYADAAKMLQPGPDEPMPDRFSVNPDSPYYDKRWASVRIGVRFDGSDRPGDVEEYCVSEGWIRVQMFMNNGKVEPYRK